MKTSQLAVVICVALAPAALRADISAKRPPAELAESVFEYLLPVLADNSEADDKSPVKSGAHGIRNFNASHTIIRSALWYGILRAAGFGVSQSWAKNGQEIGSALAFFDATNQKNLESGFEKLFGHALVRKRSGAGDNTRFSYDPAALEAAFQKLYLPPTASLGGARAQVVYDTLFRAWVASRAEAIAGILDQKGFLADAARDLGKQAGAPSFEGSMWQATIAKKLPGALANEPRLVGTLVRRHADGTLPTVLKLLRRVLGDYDRKTLERLDARLHAPAA